MLRLTGLDDNVDVYRDEWGIPTIRATSEHDVFFAQGVVHACDRLFQLDLVRRAGTGRLAEIVGAGAVPADRLVRTLGFHRQAQAELELLSNETRAAIAAYTAGINSWIDRTRHRLPVEFRVLGYRPERWRASDCLLATRLMALNLCANWQSELVRAEIAATYGNDVLGVLDADADTRAFPAQLGTEVLGELVTAARDITGTIGLGHGTGSNNWVIGPRRTASGGALLANDPHLDLTLPSIWYEQLLRGPGYEVRGFTIPGAPGVILGHNEHVAWGFTNSCVDVQDLFVEQVDEAAGTYLDSDGEWKPLESRLEHIRVKGEDDQVMEVRSSRRGPFITDAVDHHADVHLSMRWDSVRPGRISDAVLGMNRADGWEPFREALSLWTAPAQNVVFADVRGNIGFQHAGEIPRRASGNGTLPQSGADPQAEWLDPVPFEEAPWAFNPRADRIVTANDRIVDDSYPHFISVEWMNGWRGQRIRNLIDADDAHTVAGQALIQRDVYSLAGEALQGALKLHPIEPKTPAGRQVLAALRAWSFELAIGDDGGIAYRLLVRALQEETFGFLGPLLPNFLGFSRTGVGGFWSLFGRTLPRLIHDIACSDSTLLDLGVTVHARQPVDGGEWEPATTWSDVLARACDRAGERWIGTSIGDELHPRLALPGTRFASSATVAASKRGRRQRFHRLRLQHPLGVVPGLRSVANHGPFPVPGDGDTVWAAGAFNNPMNDNAMVGPSHRHVVDLGDLDASQAVLCGGQSGHPASPHYVDQVGLWRAGELRAAPWTQERIERDAAYHQRLVPGA